jgi:hypothetical protein
MSIPLFQADLSRCHAVDALIGSTACVFPVITTVFALYLPAVVMPNDVTEAA